MNKRNFTALFAILILLISPKNAFAQEVSFLSPMPGIVFVLENDSLSRAPDKSPDFKTSIIEKFRYERDQFHAGRRTKAKFYNPFTIVYRLLGL